MENQLQEAIAVQKVALNHALVSAVEIALNNMGQDKLGLDWFSSYSNQYNEINSRRVAA